MTGGRALPSHAMHLDFFLFDIRLFGCGRRCAPFGAIAALILHRRFRKQCGGEYSLQVIGSLLGAFLVPRDVVV